MPGPKCPVENGKQVTGSQLLTYKTHPVHATIPISYTMKTLNKKGTGKRERETSEASATVEDKQPRTHNKSGLTRLSILRHTDEEIAGLEPSLKAKLKPMDFEFVKHSRCKVWTRIKDKITLGGKV